jgi:phospholipid N-methyltransferase
MLDSAIKNVAARTKLRHTIFGQFFANPQTTGAICASSPELSKLITEDIGVEDASCVVELGPGTGAVTGFIASSVKPEAKFFAVELNKRMFAAIKKRYPDVKVYNECASKLPELLEKEGCRHADVVISGLPWASFPDELQEEILDSVVAVMPKGGAFATFAYLQGTFLPAGRSFKKRLTKYFSKVVKSKVIWRNLPPAFVYRCWK